MPVETIAHYRIIRPLGAGGMGEVFLAEDTVLGRKVAIKMLSEQWVGNDQARQRLINEARAAAALDHPNICAIHEVGEEHGQVFIVMPFLDGQSLAERIWNHPLSPGEIIDIGIQAADALATAHAAGVIHRDIKPHNIIVTTRGDVKVLDFGLAKKTQSELNEPTDATTIARLTEVGIVLGTPGYMSPEQAHGRALDARSDIFSLGVTLYECATGVHAFHGGTPFEVSMRVVTETLPPPSIKNPSIPQSLDRIIVRAMAKNPAERYESAAALAADLKLAKAEVSGAHPYPQPLPSHRSHPVSSQPLPLLSQTAKPRGISFRAAATVVISVLALIAMGWGMSGWFRGKRHVPPPEAVVWFDRGTTAIREGAYVQATRALERALDIDHSFALARARMAEAYAEIELGDRAKEELVQAMALLPDRSSLSDAESSYVDAVAATLSRNLKTAIEKYAHIADSAADADKAAAYVDLGRAYEKDDNLEKAIDAYSTAAQLNPQSAAAFLRTGTLHARSQKIAQANEAFSRAEDIYRAMSNQEGLAEVYYQRGWLLSRIRRLPEAKEQLERSLELARTAANDYQAIRAQLQLSNVYYAGGESVRAKTAAADAVKAAQTNNMRTLATSGLIDLGYTLLARGEFTETRSYLEEALALARQDKSTRLEARAQLALGSLSTQEGRFDEAVAHLEPALAFFQPAGYRIEASNARILLGRAYRDKGDYAVAMKAFTEQLALATQANDTARMAATHSSLGVLLGEHQEQYPEALPHFDESYRINASTGTRVGMGNDLVNRAASLIMLGRFEEAAASLDEAHGIASAPDAQLKSLLASVEATRGQLALSQGRVADARARATAALTLAEPDFEDLAMQARQTLAQVQASSGSAKQALALVEQTVASANEMKLPRLISSALLVAAEVRLAAGDTGASLADALAAEQMFTAAGQLESGWRAWLLAARAATLERDSANAYDYAARAEAMRIALQARWGDSYTGYAQRPDIQVQLKQLSQLLAARAVGSRT